MTLKEIAAFLSAVVPDISHYDNMEGTEPYTYWEETRALPYTADGSHLGGWRFYVHRYTHDEDDAPAAALFEALDQEDRISFSYQTDYIPERDFVHHIFECEGF